MNEAGIEILLVEDNPDDLELALMALKSHNIANIVVIARDGAEALDRVFCTGQYSGKQIGEIPVLVLLDLNLPKVDGLDVLRRIRSDPETKATPVIIMTSSKEEEDFVASYRYGANSFIMKPLDFPKLAETISRLGLRLLLLDKAADAGESTAQIT